MHRIDVQRQPVPHGKVFSGPPQETGMRMGIDQARHQHGISDTFDRRRWRFRRKQIQPLDREDAPICDVDSAIGNDAILPIHGEQKVARENERGAGHVKTRLSTLASLKSMPEFRMKSAARSPMTVTGACVLQLGMIGITEASAMRRPSIPRTASRSSTTDMPSLPILAVPQV